MLKTAIVAIALLAAPLSSAAFSLTLAWDPVYDSRVGGYDVYYGTASQTYTEHVSTKEIWITINGLSKGNRYYFAAKACTEDRSACGGFSNEVVYGEAAVQEQTAIALKIINVGVVGRNSVEVQFAWDDPASVAGISYSLCVIPSTTTCDWSAPTAITGTRHKTLRLKPRSLYKASVRAYVGSGLSGTSNTLVFNTKRVTIKK